MPESLDEDVLERVAQGAQRSRDDPRTGKLITSQPRAFWQAHEELRIAQGLSIRRYCERHGLALSTLRRWSSKLAGLPRQRGSTRTKLAAVGFLPCDEVKCLLWDRTGFWCLYKRIERGRLPDPQALASRGISMGELSAWLDGIDTSGSRKLSSVHSRHERSPAA